MTWVDQLLSLLTGPGAREPRLAPSRDREADDLEQRARRAIDAMERQARLITGPVERR